MKMRPHLTLTLIALFLAALGMGTALAGTKPLNLLIITADDMNADSPGWMGNTVIKTPNLDAFAATGHRFINNHVAAPICQPSRSALMTGRVPHRNGALGFGPIQEDVPTLVELLQKQGYFAACVNKVVHMAPRSKFPWDATADGSGKNPEQIGVDVAAAVQAASKAGKPFFINANITDPHRPFYGTAKGGGAKARKKAAKAAGTDADAEAAGEGDTDKNEAKIQPYAPEAVQIPTFLEDVPNLRKEVAQYDSSVLRFDVSFGKIMEALKASGQEERTLVVFLSDHGMSFPFSKATVYRNGTWSPVIVRMPGAAKPVVHEEYVSSVDVLPTVLDLLSVPAPEGLDGRTWVPLIKGETQTDRDHVFTHVNTVSSGTSFPQRCVRTKTRSLIFSAWVGGPKDFKVEAMSGLSFQALAEAAKTDPQIASRVAQLLKGSPLALYDPEKDPDERVNVLAEPQYQKDVEALVKLLLNQMQRTGDPQLENFKGCLAGGGKTK
ncbi:MAG: sulfatase [Verrucomicrobium sp.]